jgi:PAS domain S-box-containing protein
MIWHFQPYLLILAFAAGLALTVAYLAWRQREMPGATALALTMLAVAWWASLNMLERAADGYELKLAFGKLQYLGIAAVPSLWLIFALSYCGYQRFLSRRNMILMWIIPVASMLLAVTNDWHHSLWRNVLLNPDNPAAALNYSDRGLWWYVALIYNYAAIIAGTIVLLRTALGFRHDLRRQMILLVLVVTIPWAANILHFFNLDPFGVDWTPFAFAISGALLAFGLLHFQLFDLSPVARDLLVENMDDGVIVLDRNNRVVDINRAGQRLIGSTTSPIGQHAEKVFAPWPELIERYQSLEQAQAELRLDPRISAEPLYVELRISPLRDRRGRLVGRLLTLRDVTRRRHSEARLRQLSRAVEQSPASIMITDPEGRIEYVNPKFTQLTGYEPSEVIGRYSNILKSGETPPEEYARLWQTIVAGGQWSGEFHNRKKNGELYWELAVISPIIDGQGRTTHFLAVKEDITERKLAEAQERRQQQRQELVYDLSMAINLSLDLQTVLQTAVDGLTRVLEVDQVGIALFDEFRRHFIVKADHPAEGNRSAVGYELPIVGNQSLLHVLETRQPLFIADAQRDPLLADIHDLMVRQRVQAVLLVPLIVRDKVSGTIGFDAIDMPRAFTEEETSLAQTVANLVAVRIEQARLFDAERAARQEVQRRIQEISGLYAVTRATSRSLVLEDVVSQALSSALTALQCEAGFVLLVDQAGLQAPLRLAADRGLTAELRAEILDESHGSPLVPYIYQRREVLLLDTAQPPSVEWVSGLTALRQLGWQTCIGVPLLHSERPLGVMVLLAHQQRDTSPIDMALFASMGHQVATAISNAQLFQTTLSERSRLKALIESSRDGIILNAMIGDIAVVNVPALQLLKLPGTPADWVNRPIRDLLWTLRRQTPRAVRAALTEMHRLQTAGADTVGEGDLEIAGRALHWQSLPVRVGVRPMGRLVVLRDMTDERALDQLREDMTHTMVHDLRNPLTSINTALNMVLTGFGGELSPQQEQVLTIAQNSAERMRELVSAILDVNRLESGRMPFLPVVVSLPDLIRDALQTQGALASGKGIELISQLDPVHTLVYADISLIQRVVQNLLGNAIKFTPPGGQIIIATRYLPGNPPPDKSEATLQIALSDTGPGIPLEIQQRLFQKFVTGSSEGTGSGLGLAFCKLAVEAHGQSIEVESTPGKGTTFRFVLEAA